MGRTKKIHKPGERKVFRLQTEMPTGVWADLTKVCAEFDVCSNKEIVLNAVYVYRKLLLEKDFVCVKLSGGRILEIRRELTKPLT